ncbi:MAG: MCE family protein, partial [Bacteroidia bacterium]|nr:MCE family protein [Bacteroidia bacterium]
MKFKISNEVKTGIILISGIFILIWGINYLKGKDFFSSQTKLVVIYPRVDGLISSNPVELNGLKIGTVRSLNIIPDNSGRIVVYLNINSDVSIPKYSTAQIYSADLLGAKSVRILLSNSTEYVSSGDTLKAAIQQTLSQDINAQVAPIKEKAETLLSSMDSVLVIFQSVFNDSTRNNLKKSFASISSSLNSIQQISSKLDNILGDQQKNIGGVIKNLRSISDNINKNNENISKAIENFASISDEIAKANLAATLNSTKKSLEETSKVLEKINRGEGTLGQLTNNDSLYNNLNNAAHSLDELMKDFKQNPKRYLNFSVVSFG